MAVVYLNLEIGVHGLSLRSQPEINRFLAEVKNALVAIHPSRIEPTTGEKYLLDGDVTIDIAESAGKIDVGVSTDPAIGDTGH